MLLGTLAARLLGNPLASKGVIATSQVRGTIRAGKAQLEQLRIFNATSSLNKFLNTKLLS